MIQFLLERICINYEHSVEPISSLGYGECRPISEALMIQHITEAWPKRTPLIFFSLLQRLDSVNGLVCCCFFFLLRRELHFPGSKGWKRIVTAGTGKNSHGKYTHGQNLCQMCFEFRLNCRDEYGSCCSVWCFEASVDFVRDCAWY